MEIGSIHFTSKKSLQEYVRDRIKNIGLCPSLKTVNIEMYNFFIDLFQHHPKYPQKIDAITDIAIVRNKIKSQVLELQIRKEDGSTDDISWINCISGTEKNTFKCALRVAIDEQIKVFRQITKYKCSICNTLDANEYHVDHENHFEELICRFLQNTKKDKPSSFKNTSDNRKCFTMEDKEYEEEWKQFHKNNARLRMLCRSCNLKRPKWKQSSN